MVRTVSVESKSPSKINSKAWNNDSMSKTVTVEKSKFKSLLQVNIDKAVNTARQRSGRNPLNGVGKLTEVNSDSEVHQEEPPVNPLSTELVQHGDVLDSDSDDSAKVHKKPAAQKNQRPAWHRNIGPSLHLRNRPTI